MNDEEIHIEPTTPRGRWVKRIWGALPALILLLLLVVIAGLSVKIKGDAKRLKAEKLAALHLERPPVNVVVQRLEPETIQDRMNLPGVVAPWVSLELKPEVSGRVIEVAVTEGERVAEGDVMLRIDPRDYRNTLDSAAAAYELAAANWERAEKLLRDELISPSKIEDVKARLITSRAEMESAKLQLERTTVTAPITGVINRLDAKVGLLLGVADPVAELLQVDRVKVVVGIPESDVNAVRGLTHIDLTIDALGSKTVTGKNVFLAKSPDTTARLYRLVLAVDNREDEILPGMFARAEVVKREVAGAIVVPLYAVITRRDDRFVYVEEGGKAVARRVEVGILDGWRIQILNGLKAGERVIVVGHRSVEDGQEVNVTRTVTDSGELVE
ncbi:MAG: efflux RND transporter periplasmic adaptor subunit [Thermodesulfobacteriota bacterium]